MKRVHFDVKNDHYYEFEHLVERSCADDLTAAVDHAVWDVVARQVVWQLRTPAFESLGIEL